MCGIIGIVGKQAVTPSIYDALTILQHRGQDAAGIATLGEGHRIHLYKGNGLVRDVFPRSELEKLHGWWVLDMSGIQLRALTTLMNPSRSMSIHPMALFLVITVT